MHLGILYFIIGLACPFEMWLKMDVIQIWISHIHQLIMSKFTFLFFDFRFRYICVCHKYLLLNVQFAFLWMRLGSIVYHKAFPLLVAYVWIQRYKCILSIYKTHSVVISRLIEQVTSVQGQKEFQKPGLRPLLNFYRLLFIERVEIFEIPYMWRYFYDLYFNNTYIIVIHFSLNTEFI